MFLDLGILTARCVGTGSGVSSVHVTVLLIGDGGIGLTSLFNMVFFSSDIMMCTQLMATISEPPNI
jgi:predicted GTPase